MSESAAHSESAPNVPMLTDPRWSQSTERGLAILACFTPGCPVLGIADLANALGMSRSTTHRYVVTLAKLGYLEQGEGERRKYRLTLKVTRLGMSAMGGTSLREHARLGLEELQRRSGCTVTLAVLDGPDVVLVDRLRGTRPGQRRIDLDQSVGSRLPAYCTATGQLLLAHLPERLRGEAITNMKIVRRAPGTITRKSALRARLQAIREELPAACEEELAPGLYSIAVPVRSDREVVAAVGMDAHHSMISLGGFRRMLGPHLLVTADMISARLGYRGEDEQISGLYSSGGGA